ncbi:MAG: Mrp/NBP35 family ATP-binding protein [Deltaproteobacteria bacterium]|nr:Mrp/NBP35 family ATP-binding protein [Deltaproteobacteria bacterium]
MRQRLLDAFAKLECPHVCADLTSNGIIGDVRGDKGKVVVELVLPTPALKDLERLEHDVTAAARGVLGDGVDIELVKKFEVRPAAVTRGGPSDLPGVKNVVLVASGKGGVGKSTVASNLAVALAEMGCKVGMLDADIYGPSAPTMFGIGEGTRPGTVPGKDPNKPMIAPLERYGVKLMSIGFLVDTTTPMVWRGPMIASAAMQLFKDVSWGELDYLIVDLPPGTGDVQLTISQQVLVAGAVVVSTPQDVALADVVRAKVMFDRVSIPVLGIVENMSWFVCDNCNKRHEIFFHGGAKSAARDMGAPFLGDVPIEPGVVAGGDRGKPVVRDMPDSASAQAFFAIAREVATGVAKLAFDQGEGFAAPSVTITGGNIRGSADKGEKKRGLPIL